MSVGWSAHRCQQQLEFVILFIIIFLKVDNFKNVKKLQKLNGKYEQIKNFSGIVKFLKWLKNI